MGIIVAAPTAGACAALPAAVVAMAEEMGLGELEMGKAMPILLLENKTRKIRWAIYRAL